MTGTNKKEILGTIPMNADGVNLVINKESDVYDHLSKRTQQLDALTKLLCGAGYESFGNYADDIQENVLWLVHDLAREINLLLPIVNEEARTEGVISEQQAILKQRQATATAKDKDQSGQDAKAV